MSLPSRAAATALLVLTAVAPLHAQDWSRDVELACTHPRYGLRLAAARKVAAAGAEAVPAIRAFQERKGKDAIPVALVEAIATSGKDGAEVVALLEEWATDRDFFWRAQALRGLADRAGEEHRELFLAAVEDPAWLTRVHGARGLHLLGREQDLVKAKALLSDPDPRVRTKFAAHLLEHGDTSGLPVLLASLLDDRTFLGDPWGKRRAREALLALQDWLGFDGGYDEAADAAANHAAVQALAEAAREKEPDALPADFSPTISKDMNADVQGGIEVLSCRNGDLFLRWTPEGEVVLGLGAADRVKIPEHAWRDLQRQRRDLPSGPIPGVVICDKMRLKWDDENLHAVAAPGALPPAFSDWLQALATALEDAGAAAAAHRVRDRLEQFAPPADK